MATLVQQSAFGPGTYRGRKFSADTLRRFVEGTNKAIAAGVPIPLLKRHAKINASDDETAQFAKEEGVGFVKRVFLNEKNEIGWEADGVPKDAVKDVKTGTMRFTSPEFRPHYESELAGVYSGPVIRHFAFAYKPGNPKQGPIAEGAMALAEAADAWQYAEDEKEPLPDPEDDGEEANAEVGANDAAVGSAKNPDMPPAATDASKLKAIIAGLAQLGVVLPSTFDLCDPKAPDLLITGLNTRIQANNDHEAELAEAENAAAGDNERPPQDAAMPFSERNKETVMPLQFSEEELAQMPESLRKRVQEGAQALLDAEARAQQFEEERLAAVNEGARRDAVAAINAAKIPAGLKTLLAEQYAEDAEDAVQFAEGEEQPRFTGVQVAEMVEQALPPGLLAAFNEEDDQEESPLHAGLEEQFDEGPPANMERGGRGLHVSANKARALVAANPIIGGFRRRDGHQSHGALVARENARVPNNVMR